MNIRTWIGTILVTQAAGYLPIHALFERKWLYWSLGLGLAGLAILLLNRYRSGSDFEDDGLYPHRGSEYTGSQLLNLLDKLDGHDG